MFGYSTEAVDVTRYGHSRLCLTHCSLKEFKPLRSHVFFIFRPHWPALLLLSLDFGKGLLRSFVISPGLWSPAPHQGESTLPRGYEQTAQPGQPGQPCSLTSVAQRDTLHYEARVQYRDRSRGYRVEHRGVGEGRLLCRFAVGPLTAGHDNSNKLRIYNR